MHLAEVVRPRPPKQLNRHRRPSPPLLLRAMTTSAGTSEVTSARTSRACSSLNLLTEIAFCPFWMRRSHASGRALDETGAADRDMPAQGQDPAPGSAAHDFGHPLA